VNGFYAGYGFAIPMNLGAHRDGQLVKTGHASVP